MWQQFFFFNAYYVYEANRLPPSPRGELRRGAVVVGTVRPQGGGEEPFQWAMQVIPYLVSGDAWRCDLSVNRGAEQGRCQLNSSRLNVSGGNVDSNLSAIF